MRTSLTHYHRHLAFIAACALVQGLPMPRVSGPAKGRVLMLAGQLAARIERGAPVSSLLEVR